jgi:hypothetical protein
LKKKIRGLEEELGNCQKAKKHYKKEMKGLKVQLKDARMNPQKLMDVRGNI